MATSAAELAAEFGYSIAFFKSQPELYKLLQTAVKNNYTPARFVAGLQNTKWFRTTSESVRKYQMLALADPATAQQQLASIRAHIQNVGGSMGAVLNRNEAHRLANVSLKFGWNEDQLKQYLAAHLDWNAKTGFTEGQAAAAQAQYEAMAKDYGVSIGRATLRSWVKETVAGSASPDTIKAALQRNAASKYVALKDRFMAGETVRDIAEPYLQSYAKILEVNGENLSLDDPLVQKALQSKGADGKPTTQTVWEFEQSLRNDPRWRKTTNAQNQTSAVASDVLRKFGLIS